MFFGSVFAAMPASGWRPGNVKGIVVVVGDPGLAGGAALAVVVLATVAGPVATLPEADCVLRPSSPQPASDTTAAIVIASARQQGVGR